MALIVAVAGLGASLTSALLLHAGVSGMATRYFVAAVAGYVAFIGLIRVWLAYQRREWSLELDIDLPTGQGSGGSGSPASGWGPAPVRGGGGAFGGGGASGSFEPPSSGVDAANVAGDSSSSVLDSAASADVDDAWPIVLVVAIVAAGVVALGFVVYTSPLLFAEVLLDAAVAGAVYRRARRREKKHWTRGVLRRTWLPATAICVLAALLGAALHLVEPEARTLGEVLEASNAGQ